MRSSVANHPVWAWSTSHLKDEGQDVMAAQVMVSRSEAALAQIVVDLADSLGEEIDPGFTVIANAGTAAAGEQGQPVPAPG